MRYKVTIAAGFSASDVANTVTAVCGDWDSTVDGDGGTGVAFVEADNDADDDTLTDAMEDHAGVLSYVCLGKTRAENLADLESLLASRGDYFHGDRIEEVAKEWLDAGFVADDASDWMIGGIWSPDTAAKLVKLGVIPYELRKVPDDTIYAWCNNDLKVVWPGDED